ncbi:MAG: hypothetical protein ACO1TE_11930 [Prosthecobacter sp.]
MACEIVWTRGAEADFLSLDDQLGDHDLALRLLWKPLSHMLALLVNYPGMGSRVGSRKLRKVLFGQKRCFGLFYTEEGKRLMLLALLDMRQDPESLNRRLREL